MRLPDLILRVTLGLREREKKKGGTRVVHSHELETVLDLKDGKEAAGSAPRAACLSPEGSFIFFLGAKVNANNLIGFPNTAQKPVWVLLLSPSPTATPLTRGALPTMT